MLDKDNFKKNIKSIKTKIKKENPIFFLSANLFSQGLYSDDLYYISDYLVREFTKIKNSTIIVPTATLDILETKKTFEKNKSKSSRMGFFSEYVRKKNNIVRSNHPLWSFSALGFYSKKITKNVPKTCYGQNSIFDRLLNYNTFYICLGDVRSSLAPIHYVEQMAGVPYRFFKEFKVKIKTGKKIKTDNYYFYAMVNSKKIKRDNNNKVVKILLKKKIMKIFKNKNFNIYFSDYKKLIHELFELLDKNPKIYLRDEKINFQKDLKF